MKEIFTRNSYKNLIKIRWKISSPCMNNRNIHYCTLEPCLKTGRVAMYLLYVLQIKTHISVSNWTEAILSTDWRQQRHNIIWQQNFVLSYKEIVYTGQGSPHIHVVKTGHLDFSLSWLKGEVRENLGDFWKSIQILTFLSLLPHVALPFTKTNIDLKRMQLTSLE